MGTEMACIPNDENGKQDRLSGTQIVETAHFIHL